MAGVAHNQRSLTGLVAALLLLIAGMSAGCSCADPTTDSTATGPSVTLISQPLELTWSPASAPPTEVEEQIAAELKARGFHFILPSVPPTGDPASASAEFNLTETVPTGEVTLEMIVRRGNEPNPLVAVQSRVGSHPARVESTQAVQVRGQPGTARTPAGAVWMLDWAEGGQNFHAEWNGLPLPEMIAWLDSWRPVP